MVRPWYSLWKPQGHWDSHGESQPLWSHQDEAGPGGPPGHRTMAPQDQGRVAPVSLARLSSSQRSQAILVSSAAKRPNPGHEQNVFCGQTDPRDPACASGKEMDRYVNFSNAHQNQVSMGLETSSVSISRLEEPYCRAPGLWSLASPFT